MSNVFNLGKIEYKDGRYFYKFYYQAQWHECESVLKFTVEKQARLAIRGINKKRMAIKAHRKYADIFNRQ